MCTSNNGTLSALDRIVPENSILHNIELTPTMFTLQLEAKALYAG